MNYGQVGSDRLVQIGQIPLTYNNCIVDGRGGKGPPDAHIRKQEGGLFYTIFTRNLTQFSRNLQFNLTSTSLSGPN